MGFSENPQAYVKGVEKHAMKEVWKYPTNIPDSQSEREVDFNHFVIV